MIPTLLASFTYAHDHAAELGKALAVHVQLAGGALLVALVLAVPAGIWVARRQGAGGGEAVMGFFNGLRVVPSIAVLFMLLPVLGIGARPALVALAVLAGPPIVVNTYAAFRGVDHAVIEAARGMGMTPGQIWRRVELPLALPVFLTGVRTAAVEVLASATLADLVGAGGLGTFVFRGFAVNRPDILLVGALPVAGLTVAFEALFAVAQRWLTRGR